MQHHTRLSLGHEITDTIITNEVNPIPSNYLRELIQLRHCITGTQYNHQKLADLFLYAYKRGVPNVHVV